MSELEHVLNAQNELGEGPLWNSQEQALYWVDIRAHRIHHLIPATHQHTVYEIGLPVGSLAFRQDGGLLLAVADQLAFWDVETQTLDFKSQVDIDNAESRFNDGAVDPQGRFWVGTLSDEYSNNLYRFDSDFSIHILETGIGVSNGIGWSPDHKIMYFTDSPTGCIYAYDFDPVRGEIENRRIFVRVPEADGKPDGLTVDGDGFIWSAHWDGWRVTRYDPTGKEVQVIKMPVQRPTSCIFGGQDLDELYITSAWIGLSKAGRKEQPLAGDLFRLKVDVGGIPEPQLLDEQES